MDLKEWRKRREGEPFTLPSGLDVKLRRCQLLDLAEQGRIPAPLVSLANTALSAPAITLTVKDYREFAPLITAIVQACLVEPEGLKAEELSAADRIAVYNWANDVIVAVQPFREKRNGSALARRGGPAIQPEAIGNSRADG